MENIFSLLYKSVRIAQSHKVLCLLSFAQIFCLYLALKIVQGLSNLKIIWLLPLVLIFSVVSIFVWRKVQSLVDNFNPALTNRFFFKTLYRVCLFFIGVVVVAASLKFLSVNWAIFIGVNGLFATCLVICMLATTLFNLGLIKSLFYTFEFIKHKTPFVSLGTLVIIVINTYGYTLTHLTFRNLSVWSGFSVFQASATIWVVFLGLAVLTAFFSGILNVFVVLYILNVTNSLKEPEHERLSLTESIAN